MSQLLWLEALRDPSLYPHPTDRIEIIHTHLSVVVLTGPFAYKFKKPVDFGFVDFTTLNKRKQACQTELALNARTAADLYLELVTLRSDGINFCLESSSKSSGDAEIVEYAVKMRQFDPELRLDRYFLHKPPTTELVEALAEQVARLHLDEPPVDHAAAESYYRRLKLALQRNFTALPPDERMSLLRRHFDQDLERYQKLFRVRASSGKIKACHGDLHLGNICLWQQRPVLFDCIEFNTDYSQIDVLSDIAFLYMDLQEKGWGAAAQYLLNYYLERTGDYGGIPLLPLFVAYRAQVRAKIAYLTAASSELPEVEKSIQYKLVEQYLDFAVQCYEKSSGGIVILCGLPASGKSTAALRWARHESALRVRSDVERKRLFAANSVQYQALYSSEMTERTYAHLLDCAEAIVAGRQTAILDATFLERRHRLAALECARRLQVPSRIQHCHAPLEVLKERILRRQAQGNDPSDATLAVLEQALRKWEPLSEEEHRHLVADSS